MRSSRYPYKTRRRDKRTFGSRRKGMGFERELVNQAKAAGIPAYRCWGSDGRSHGLPKEVDLVLNGSIKLQAKRRSKLPAWLGFTDALDGVVLRQDHGETMAVISWEWLLSIMARALLSGGIPPAPAVSKGVTKRPRIIHHTKVKSIPSTLVKEDPVPSTVPDTTPTRPTLDEGTKADASRAGQGAPLHPIESTVEEDPQPIPSTAQPDGAGATFVSKDSSGEYDTHRGDEGAGEGEGVSGPTSESKPQCDPHPADPSLPIPSDDASGDVDDCNQELQALKDRLQHLQHLPSPKKQPEKLCPKCRTSKPHAAFYHSTSRTDGLSGWCVECHQAVGKLKRGQFGSWKPKPTPLKLRAKQHRLRLMLKQCKRPRGEG